MCGICGFVLAPDSRHVIDRDRLARMRDTMTHRGPDEAGLYLRGRAGLGHRRLSIVDLSHGQQPMATDDHQMHLVYNGEIYNHLDIRGILEARGHRYRTNSDTESVLRVYQEEGSRGVNRLRGMFAFAVWDEKRGEMFLARDRIGIKPLYYLHAEDGSLFFASEIKALLESGAVEPRLNVRVLPDYLANHAPSGEDTLFQGIRRLPAGHTLLWRDGKVELQRYWSVSFREIDGDERSDTEMIGGFAERFEEAVRIRLMADVPLGVFLSGGIDSSAIAAVMSRLVHEPIKTFAVAFEERGANELSYARLLSRRFGTDHHEIVVSPESFFAALPKLVWHEDEPIAHPSSIPLHFVSKLAQERVKVVLTGEGSDELLAGYGRYWKTVRNLQLGEGYERVTTSSVRGLVRRTIDALPVGSRAHQKLRRTFLYLPSEIESIYFDNFAVFSRAQQIDLLSAEMRQQLGDIDPYASHRALLESSDSDRLLNRLLYADVQTYLQELLMKQDQMSMSASVESRVPFLDHRLVEFVAGLPERMKLRGLESKHILRKSMEGILPPEILRRPKMGFPVPFGAWIRGRYRPLLDDLVLSDRVAARGVFQMSTLRRLVDEHQAGVDHGERLWSLANFELWQRRFLDGEVPAEVGASAEARVVA
jgi:asparagine synthase (glutamine-hydrolysing)